jgi:hypothetical protein
MMGRIVGMSPVIRWGKSVIWFQVIICWNNCLFILHVVRLMLSFSDQNANVNSTEISPLWLVRHCFYLFQSCLKEAGFSHTFRDPDSQYLPWLPTLFPCLGSFCTNFCQDFVGVKKLLSNVKNHFRIYTSKWMPPMPS